MTIIAYDGKTLATDSLRTGNDMVLDTNCKKIHDMTEDSFFSYVAICGDIQYEQDIISWLYDGIYHRPAPSGNWAALLIHRETGEPYELFNDVKCPVKVSLPYFQGSGAAIALGAYHAAATIEEAVSIAIDLDIYSGGEMQSVSLQVAEGDF